MTLHAHTSIVPCADGQGIPTVQCDFVPIGELENRDSDAIIGTEKICCLARSEHWATKIADRFMKEIVSLTTKTAFHKHNLAFYLSKLNKISHPNKKSYIDCQSLRGPPGHGSSVQNMVVVVIFHHLGYRLAIVSHIPDSCTILTRMLRAGRTDKRHTWVSPTTS